ncbi:MAG: glycosyltransferase family 2 protein [Candidatus Diapherotrites archaeon]
MAKTAVIIPAYNEEEYISDVLNSALKWHKKDPRNRSVIVVNDGSKDRTAEIARKSGATVLRSDGKKISKEGLNGPNMGKAEAVRRGVIHAASQGCSAIVMLDADLSPFEPRKIDELVMHLNKPNVDMVVAKIDSEGSYSKFSGQRAIKVSALRGFINGVASWKELAQGYGLEHALNSLVQKKVDSSLLFEQKRKVRRTDQMDREMTRTFGLAIRRRSYAEKLVDSLVRRVNSSIRRRK